ncbi:MAG: hypothetical protein QOI41_1831 [Myxococcales bacterium]|nr:hypothetical protein [Myxococcales bacterium]
MTGERLAIFGGTPTLGRSRHRRWPDLGEDERSAVARVIARGVLSGPRAPESMAFEDEFARFASAKHALLTHSGTSALHLALAASGLRAGDHVLVPAYSFVATPLAVLHAGGIPIFVDVEETTGLLDIDAARAALTSRTRAIMPVHVHGCAADMGSVSKLAKEHGLLVVEDAAQAHGATWNGQAVGALGSAGGFSLQSSKNLGVGEGGVLVTNDDAVADAADALRNFGQTQEPREGGRRMSTDLERPLDTGRAPPSGRVGWMYRGNEVSAAIARAALAHLPERTERCQDNADRLARALSDLPGVSPPYVPRGSTSVHHKFRVRLDPQRAGVAASARALRDATMRALQAEGLEVVLWQTQPLPAHPVFRAREGLGGGWPWSNDRETTYDTLYDPARFPRTQQLLDGSVVLFSQSCPLIAQDASTVDAYADAFRRVWAHREQLVSGSERAHEPVARP